MILYFLKIHPEFGGEKLFFDCACSLQKYITKKMKDYLNKDKKPKFTHDWQKASWLKLSSHEKEVLMQDCINVVRIDKEQIPEYQNLFMAKEKDGRNERPD